MKFTQLFNDLYERLFDTKEDNWAQLKAATIPFMVVFGIVLMLAFFAVIYLIQAFWKP
ncbi:MAG: hypothetical protein IT260_07525 [Saprospiraceae bacterium]|nr:hypothetical protein [Saprospiraceae bacterium]